MNYPGDYALCEQTITNALAGSVYTPLTDVEGAVAMSIMARFAYGSGGTTAKVYIQTTLDDGATWIDIACFAFTTAAAIKVVNLSGLTPVLTAFTPVDGALADNTVQDGVLGPAIRAKLTTTGTYASTLLTVKAVLR